MALNSRKFMKIIDSFMFHNELDVLELRLNVLDPVVDYFVIVESNYSHIGNPKPLVYKWNSSRFNKFANKIIYLVVDLKLDPNPLIVNWQYRDYLSRYICSQSWVDVKEDFILHGDLDEIPNPDKVIELRDTKAPVTVFQHSFYDYALDLRQVDDDYSWLRGTIFGKITDFKEPLSQTREHWANYNLVKAGWHYQNMGGPKTVSEKLNRFAHCNEMIPFNRSENFVRSKIKEKTDISGNIKLEQIQLDATTSPAYLLNNLDKYKHMLYNNVVNL